jgi:hypothetical protein
VSVVTSDHGATRSRFAGWNIPPLLRGAALGGELPQDFRLGELAVGRLHSVDTHCEVYLVTHAGDGASYMARVARRSALAQQPELAETMLDSARRLRGHACPHLPTVIGSGLTREATPRPYVVHERVVGRDLAAYQAHHGGVEPSLLLAVGVQCAAALEALHRLGLAHTEVRRSCTLLVPAGGDQFRIKLGGLERARAIRPGATAADEPLIAADLAALAVMLQELAVGCEDDAAAGELARVVAWITAAEGRPATAAEVRDAIAAIGGDAFGGAAEAECDDSSIAPAEPIGWGMTRRGDERRAQEFGQISLVMPRERPVNPSRIAASSRLLAGIVLLSVITALLVAWLGAPDREPEARRLSVIDREQAPAPASRTVPIQRPVPFVLREPVERRCDDAEPVAAREVAPPQRKSAAPLPSLPRLQPIVPAPEMVPEEPPPVAEPSPPVAESSPPEQAADPTDKLLPVRTRPENTASTVFLGVAQNG